MKPYVVFIEGISDLRTTHVNAVTPGGSLNYRISGSTNVFNYLSDKSIEMHRILLDTRPSFEMELLRRPDLIFNQIADADSHRLTLRKVLRILTELGHSCPVINHPEAVLKTTRDQVSEKLQGIAQLKVPHTIRFRPTSPDEILAAIKAADLKFPVILRACGEHNGLKTVLLESEQAIQTLYSLALDGQAYYLSQFYDWSRQGVYRKIRLIVVDGQAYLRHLRMGPDWNIHYDNCIEFMKAKPELLKAEIQALKDFDTDLKPRVQPIVSQIYEALQLDYFGIDCDLNEQGEMLLFEANANMHALHPSENVTRYDETITRIKLALDTLIRHKMQALSPKA